jgi:hypothetical protein
MKFWERFGIVIMSLWLLFAVHQGINTLVKAHNWQPLSASDWGTWAGAIGTVATLIGTIHLARTETRRRERSELLLAQLHAAGMLLRMERAHGIVVIAIAQLNHVMETTELPNAILDNRLAHPFLTWTVENLNQIEIWGGADLVPLAPLPNHVASKLAQAAEQLRTVKRLLEEALTDTPSNRLRIECSLRAALREFCGEMDVDEEALDRLEAARTSADILRTTAIFLGEAVQVFRATPIKTHHVQTPDA